MTVLVKIGILALANMWDMAPDVSKSVLIRIFGGKGGQAR